MNRERGWGRPAEPAVSKSTTAGMTRREFIQTTAAGAAGLSALASVPRAATAQGGGLPIPSLEDERNTYRSWGWTWSASAEPNYQSDSGFNVSNPDIHYDTEGDDLWTSVMMYRRTGQQGYLHRSQAWANYFKSGYRACSGSSDRNYCFDRDAFQLDHLYGWGLVAWYQYSGDTAALNEAVSLAAVVESMWSGRSLGYDMGYYGLRQGGRHLLLMCRVAEVTGDPRWIAARDKLLNLWMQSPSWDNTRGMYFVSAEQTGYVLGSSAWGNGIRIQSAFQIGILNEALYQAYRTTNRTDVRDRLIAMARFADQFGLDPTYQYTGSWFGHRNGVVWHNYSAGGTTTFWDPVYCTSLVNTLVRGYKYTNDRNYYDRGKYFFNRGTKGVYGSVTQRTAPDTVAHHFVDSRFDGSTGNLYYDYNKGELQYTYQLFENGPTDSLAPSAPASLQVR